jgi:hypothetical protein
LVWIRRDWAEGRRESGFKTERRSSGRSRFLRRGGVYCGPNVNPFFGLGGGAGVLGGVLICPKTQVPFGWDGMRLGPLPPFPPAYL